MATTPVYGLPYQTTSDQPNGPLLGQALAEAVEAQIARLDSPASCIVSRSTNTPITSGGSGVVVPWTLEERDTAGIWTSGSPTRLTIPAGLGGLWCVKAYIAFDSNATGVRDAHILVNGSPLWEDRRTGAGGVSGQAVSVTGDVVASAGQYIEIRALQNSGVTLNVTAGRVSIYRVSA